jgi:hypothetical protein
MTLGLAVMALIRSCPPERFRWIVASGTLAALIGFGFWQMRSLAAASMVLYRRIRQQIDLLEIRGSVAPMDNRLPLQRGTRALFRFFSGRFRARPYLLDAGEEQVTTVFLVERHRVLIA